jgi:2'-5' RNA ligase
VGDLRLDAAADSIWVGLRIPPEIASQLVEPAEVPHVTMVYVGPGTPEQADWISELVADVAPSIVGAVAELRGLDYFDHDDKRVAYVKVAVPVEVETVQALLVERIQAAGIEVKQRPQPWIPHATLAYLEPGDGYSGIIPTGTWTIDTIEVWRGGEVVGAARMDRLEKRGDKWVVLSEDCKTELGTYDTEDEARERMRQVEAAKAARGDAKPMDEVERQATIVEFFSLVNMTPSEIKRWADGPFAGPTRKSGTAAKRAETLSQAITDLVDKDVTEWDDVDFGGASVTVREITRLLDAAPGEPLEIDGKTGPTKRDADLMDLGHDPSKEDARADGVRQDALGQWEWRTQDDGKVRPEHASLHGVRFDVGEVHPGQGTPGAAYGCRCYPAIVPKRGTVREANAIERAARYAQAYALNRWAAEDEGERADKGPRRSAAVHTESRNTFEDWRKDAIAILPPEELANGWKRYPVRYSKAGNVQHYPHLGLWEFRPHDAVHAPESLALYAGIPWELRHSPALLTRATVKGKASGVVMNAEVDADGVHTFGYSIAWAGDLIDAIDSGEASEQSLAFKVVAVRESGTNDYGVGFNSRVIRVIPNSLAAEPHGRAETTRVLSERFDAASGVTVHTATELLEIAKRGVPSANPIFFDLRDWHRRADAAPLLPEDVSPMKFIEMMLAAAGKTIADLALALGIPEADIAKAMEDPAILPKICEFLSPKAIAVEAEQDGSGKIKIGDAEFEVDPAVAAHIAKLEEAVKMQEGRADRADTLRVKAEADSKIRQDAMATMMPRADALAMAHEQALSAGRVLALHQSIYGQTEPEQRQDAAGAAVPLTLADYKRNIIRAVYKDQAQEILDRLDAKPVAIRDELIDDRMIDAAKIHAESKHTGAEVDTSIARMRTNVVARQDAKPDPLVEAMGRQRDPHAAQQAGV